MVLEMEALNYVHVMWAFDVGFGVDLDIDTIDAVVMEQVMALLIVDLVNNCYVKVM